MRARGEGDPEDAPATTAAAAPDLAVVDQRLRELLAPHRAGLTVTEDAVRLTLELPGREGEPAGFVAGTRMGKRYVSVYLMSVYADPTLLDATSPALRRRMQGKACFNFSRVDEPLFTELAALLARGIERHSEAVGTALARRARR